MYIVQMSLGDFINANKVAIIIVIALVTVIGLLLYKVYGSTTTEPVTQPPPVPYMPASPEPRQISVPQVNNAPESSEEESSEESSSEDEEEQQPPVNTSTQEVGEEEEESSEESSSEEDKEPTQEATAVENAKAKTLNSFITVTAAPSTKKSAAPKVVLADKAQVHANEPVDDAQDVKTCSFKIRSGPKKDQPCGRPVMDGYELCMIHKAA